MNYLIDSEDEFDECYDEYKVIKDISEHDVNNMLRVKCIDDLIEDSDYYTEDCIDDIY